MSGAFLTTSAAKVLAPREVAVGSRLPYLGHADDVTLRTRDGLLVQTLHLAGFPFETAPDDELNYRKAIRETVLRGAASSRLAVYHHVVRRRVTPAFPPAPEEPFCANLDAHWREQLASRRLYVNDIFLTLVMRPTQGGAGFLERLMKGSRNREVDSARDLRDLHATREAFAAALAPSGALSNAIAARRLSFGLDAMEFGGGPEGPTFGAMVSMKDYPARTVPGLLDGVLRLPMEMVLTESFAFVDRQVALDRMGLALRRLKAAEDDAFSLRGELAQARDDVGAGRAAYGEHHLTILAKAETLDELDSGVADT